MNFLRPKFQKVINRVQAIRRHFHRPHQISEGGTYTGTGIETYADADAEKIEDQSIDHSSYQSVRMNFLRTKLQTVINRVQAIRRRFRLPCPILEVVAKAKADVEVPEPFQLLDLPHVALRKIVMHLNPLTLVDLSMMSDEFHEKMKGIKLPADLFTWDLTKNGMFITCHFESSFFLLYCLPKAPRGPVVKRRIGGKVRLVYLDRDDEPEDDRDDEPEYPEELTDQKKKSKFPLTCLISSSQKQFLFQEVAVREIVIEFERRPGYWRKKQRAKLLETTRTIQLRNTIQEVTVINLDLLFSAENIINSEIKLLWMFSFCEDPHKPVFYKELNKIMKAWQEGEKLTQLEKIETSSKGVSDEELESLFEGIDWTSERPNHPQFESYAPTHGLIRDSFIRRKTDGQLASFSDYRNKFFFVVWKEGQLNLDLIYQS